MQYFAITPTLNQAEAHQAVAALGGRRLPGALRSYLAWRFDSVLPGTFRRNKADFAHHLYPVLGPLPTAARNTPALETSRQAGPYLYFVCDDQAHVRYVGKSLEDQVLQRWIRPGIGGPAKQYWTHSTKRGGCVFNIAQGLQSGQSAQYTLRYAPLGEIGDDVWLELGLTCAPALEVAERAFIAVLGADWNRS